MKELFLDCEYNGFGGELITMAIVDCHGHEFYEYKALTPGIHLNLWCVGNVFPVIGKPPIYEKDFKEKLESFLTHYEDGFRIICDWPEDLIYFCKSIIKYGGAMMNIPIFEALVDRNLNSSESLIPHNALEDARAIQKQYLQRKKSEVS